MKIKSILKILFGNFLLAVSVNYFVLPYDILSGGVAGISLIFEKLFNWNNIIMIDVLTLAFFVLGRVFLSRDFAIKTALSSIAYPVMVTILNKIPYNIEADEILIAIFGGVIAGCGIGLVLQEDASTGGTDVPPMIINKITGISVPVLMFITDGIITIAGLLSYNLKDVMIGLIYIYISNVIIEKVISPKETGIALYIISDKNEEIISYIHKVMERGTTILYGKGGYTNNEKEIILTVVYKRQYRQLLDKIDEIDPKAFVIINDAKEIKGEGFSYEYRV